MTIVVYRDGVMAADTGAWASSAKHSFGDKLAMGTDGTLYGVAGHAAPSETFLDWVRAGADGVPPLPERCSDRESAFVVLIVAPGGPIRLLTAFGEEKYPDATYFAVGAGAPVAWGALFAGASAKVAVRAALEHSEYAHGKVKILSHHNEAHHEHT
ncbi:hypothetical protein CFBP5507_04360 [Agrobacterium salinitolerans]|uniref:Uncharacterized protein n=1 Tax=Agrobacterium salinitolerans TaxID=1183413 RepID=A0A4Z1R588_9HYPH|nr:hypothetical protein [Agrobacterium salinitolerans]UYZ08246.1 hypothetical protein CFBP5507_04360 [Agrobacterium salinitolerans]